MFALNRGKILFILGLSLAGFLLSLPPFLKDKVSFPSWFPQKELILGLDLQGGAHLLLEVDQKKLLTDRYALLVDQVRKALRQERIGYMNLAAHPSGILFDVRELSQGSRLNALLEPLDTGVVVEMTGSKVHVSLSPTAVQHIVGRAVEKSIETIRRRVDETGTKEPLIQSQGEGRIILQVPGIDDPERIKDLIGKTAQLSFQMVDQLVSTEEAPTFAVPPGKELLPDHETVEGKPRIYYLIDKEVLLSGDMLVDARPTFDEYERPMVSFAFNHFGATRFGDVTRENVGRPFAIVLDREVISAPQIREPILGGAGVIQGNSTLQEVQDLSLLMRSGALPAPLVVLEERTVGPGLGADSIHKGTYATIMAIIFVAMFMLLAYSWFSTFANIAIIFNVALLITSLVYLGASLTLPGIAGIALTIGMAVDANVLINERIKEELRLGRKMIQAIDMGYQRAMSTIIDSNLTTLIGACLLYYFGTGSVRGFGVTLSLGIIISMFTAVSLSRVFIYLWIHLKKPKRLWL